MNISLLELAASIFQPQPFEPATTTKRAQAQSESETQREEAAIQRARVRGQLRRAIRIAGGRKAHTLKEAAQCTQELELEN